MSATYKMMTAKEAIDYLFELPDDQRELSFTFDDLDYDPDCDPSGWHGMKVMNIFDEWHGVFAIGYWGGGSTVAYDIYGLTEDENDGVHVREFCANQLQNYMNNWCDMSKLCEKICVEIEED